MVNWQRSRSRFFIGFLTILLFAACSNSGVNVTVDKSERLSQRLNSYISARKHSNLGQLQQLYIQPEQARVGKIIVKECVVSDINIQSDGLKAETKLENKIQAMGFTFEKVPVVLNWVWNDNDWYIEMKNSKGNPFTGKK